jgi:hypothetical protein
MKRLTLEDCKKTAQDKGGTCLADEYKSDREMLLWKCRRGHEWTASYNSVRHRSWCPNCAGNIKRSISDCHDAARANNGLCLSESYVNHYTMIKWKCHNGHVWEASLYDTRNGKWCNECISINPQNRKCDGCGRTLELSPIYWSANARSLHGFRSPCRNCRNKAKRASRLSNPGLYRELDREWKANNRAKVAASKSRDYRKHRDKRLEASKLWRKDNLEYDAKRKHERYMAKKKEIAEYNRVYYRNNRDHILESVAAWVKNNPEKARAIQIRRKERQMELDSVITAEHIAVLHDVFGNRCFRCKAEKDICLDHHKPLSKGNGLSLLNAVLLCRSCNSSKHDKMPEEFYSDEDLVAINDIFKKLGELI